MSAVVVDRERKLSHRDVALVALPITMSNATTPLVGFVDTLAIGQLGATHLIGGVAIGATIFNTLYMAFGFLRMGTTGLTAQAAGARDEAEVAANLIRALMIAFGTGLAIVLGQTAVAQVSLWTIGPSPAVAAAAIDYFDMRIWAAPAGLANFALLGWFIGIGRSTVAFWLQIVLNLANVALAFLFVMGLGLGVQGAGLAALLSEVAAAVLGLLAAARELRTRGASIRWRSVADLERLKRMWAVNADILIRTVSVLAAFVFFTAQGAQAGDLTLAANALLLSISAVMIYLLDGFAFAAETLVGQAIGAGARERYREAVRMTTIWAGAFGLGLTLLTWLAGPSLIALMTPNPEVRAAAGLYLPWAALTPIMGVWCFQLDGIFIGATRTADMRNMMLLSLAFYFIACAVLQGPFGNHGLWASLQLFYVVRALSLLIRLPALERATFGSASSTTALATFRTPL